MNLRKIPFHAKTWRPQLLVLTQSMIEDEALVVFSWNFGAGGGGMTLCGQVVVGAFREMLPLHSLDNAEGYRSVRFRVSKSVRGTIRQVSVKHNVFFDVVIADSVQKGAQVLFFSTGLGKLRPNTALIGFPEGWQDKSRVALTEYMSVVRDALEVGSSVMLCRGVDRLSYTPSALPSGNIDVYWLVDDGGFGILMPWLLVNQPFWSNCQLRIFTIPGKTSLDQVAALAANFSRMVKEFRIDAKVKVLVPDELDPLEYARLVAQFGIQVPQDEAERLSRYFRLSKLMQATSSESELVFATLPFPRDEHLGPELWFHWLEIMANPQKIFDSEAIMPPIVFLRGNQQSLLSIYM